MRDLGVGQALAIGPSTSVRAASGPPAAGPAAAAAAGAGPAPAARPARHSVSSSRGVTRGATTASPLATSRTALTSSAGATSLSRKALAPACSPAKAYSSRSKVVRMMTRAVRPGGDDLPGGLDPVQHRHPHVHQHHIRLQLPRPGPPPRRRRTPRPPPRRRPRPPGSAGSPSAAAAGRPPAGPHRPRGAVFGALRTLLFSLSGPVQCCLHHPTTAGAADRWQRGPP